MDKRVLVDSTACACTTNSAKRLEAPITFVGRTALSIEISNTWRTQLAIAARQTGLWNKRYWPNPLTDWPHLRDVFISSSMENQINSLIGKQALKQMGVGSSTEDRLKINSVR